MADGLVPPALVLQGDAQIGVGQGGFGIEGEGPAVVPHGLVQPVSFRALPRLLSAPGDSGRTASAAR